MFRSKTCTALALILALGATPALAQQTMHQQDSGTAAGAAAGAPQQGGAAGMMSGSGGMPMMGMMGQDMMGQGMMGRGIPMMGMMGGGMGPMGMMSARAGRIEGRIAFLKAELKITDAQLPLWNAVADAMRDNVKAMAATRGRMMGMMSQPATLPDRLAAQEKAIAARLDAVRKLKAAVEPLYASLSDEQKKTADELTSGMGGGGMMGRGMMGGGMMGSGMMGGMRGQGMMGGNR